jgi:hypothetical protein
VRRSIVLPIVILSGCLTHKPPPAGPPPANPNQAGNDKAYQKVLEQIAGHETEAAGKVFKNVKLPMMQNVPAKTLLNIMNMGYAKALGASCLHRHADHETAVHCKARLHGHDADVLRQGLFELTEQLRPRERAEDIRGRELGRGTVADYLAFVVDRNGNASEVTQSAEIDHPACLRPRVGAFVAVR